MTRWSIYALFIPFEVVEACELSVLVGSGKFHVFILDTLIKAHMDIYIGVFLSITIAKQFYAWLF